MSLLLLFLMFKAIIKIGILSFEFITMSIKKVLIWILNLSDKRIVAMSFRLALIFAIIGTVMLNRYQPFLKEYESSTTVFEIIASSIIIPVIFTWIHSTMQEKQSESKDFLPQTQE